MLQSVLWFCVVLSLAISAGPITYVLSQAGRGDPNALYLILDMRGQSRGLERSIRLGARAVGPESGILASMIQATPDIRDRLTREGFIILPAGALAALCGYQPEQLKPPLRVN